MTVRDQRERREVLESSKKMCMGCTDIELVMDREDEVQIDMTLPKIHKEEQVSQRYEALHPPPQRFLRPTSRGDADLPSFEPTSLTAGSRRSNTRRRHSVSRIESGSAASEQLSHESTLPRTNSLNSRLNDAGQSSNVERRNIARRLRNRQVGVQITRGEEGRAVAPIFTLYL